MSRTQVLVSLVGGLVGLGFAFALFLRFGPDTEVSSQLRGYVVQSDRAVVVEWEVAREPGTEVFCVIRSRAESGLEVGRRFVDVPPAQARTTVERAVLQTTDRAVTGELVGCARGRAADQPSPTPSP